MGQEAHHGSPPGSTPHTADANASETVAWEHYVTIWAKAVDTQMHFNEMSVKSRQLGLAFVAAALGVSVFLLSREEDFSFSLRWFELHVSVFLLLAALVALQAVKRLDLFVYHRMLRGAVTFGEDFEEQYMKRIFQLEKGMTQAISHYSRHDDAGRARGPNGKYHYSGTDEITAEKKIQRFYTFTTWALIIAAAALFAVQNIERVIGDGNQSIGSGQTSHAITPAPDAADSRMRTEEDGAKPKTLRQ